MLHLFTSPLFNARNMPNEFGGTTQGPKSNERPSARWERFSSIALCQNIVTDFDTFDSVTRSIAQRNDDSIGFSYQQKTGEKAFAWMFWTAAAVLYGLIALIIWRVATWI